MLWLIDGYNLMHAQGALGSKPMGAENFRRSRRRFLNGLAEALGSERARETTVVFDASTPPGDFSILASYKGMSLIFAVEDEDADTRIERILAQHSSPRSLTVVSSDRRLRQAASRRKAKTVTADEFLDQLEKFSRIKRPAARPGHSEATTHFDRESLPTPEESDYWQRAFRHLDEAEETRQAFTPDPAMLTDAEIAQIQREVDRER